MIKVDERYLKTGLRIKKDASNVLSSLSVEEKKLELINSKLLEVTEELEDFKDKTSDYSDLESLKEDFFKKLSNVEDQSVMLKNLIEPLNRKMEKLKKEEEVLWDTVKEKYSSKLSEDEIIEQFQNYIEENNK